MADADGPQQLLHVARVEDVANQAPGFPQVEFAIVVRGHPGGILAAVLQHQQGAVNVMADTRSRNHADNAAHDVSPPIFLPASHHRKL